MTRFSIEHSSGSMVLSGVALLLICISFAWGNVTLGLGALVFTLWGLTFVRVRAERDI